MTLDALIQEARKLSPAERAELVDAMIILDGPGLDLTPEQQEDLARRIEEYDAGKAKMIPGDEVVAMLRKRN
jgi:putative addiction module component (TIGR02574 family)